MLFSSKLRQPSWIVRTKQTVERFIDLSTLMDLGMLWLPKRVLCKFDVIFVACAAWYCWITPNRGTRVFTKVSHSGNPVKILSLGGCSSQNLVILAKSEPSGLLLDIENAAQAHSVTPRCFFLEKCSPECVAGTQNSWIGLFRIKFQSLRGVQSLWPLPAIFLNRGICLVCTQEDLLGPFGWKMKAFGLCLPYSGSTEVLCFRFFVTVFRNFGQNACLGTVKISVIRRIW